MTAPEPDAAVDPVLVLSGVYQQALWDYEDALATRDPARRETAGLALAEAARRLSAAQSARVAARSTVATWSTLLSDPTQQLDPNGEVWQSIRDHQNAKSDTPSADWWNQR